MSNYELFQSQMTLIMTLLTDSVKQDMRKAFTCSSIESCSHHIKPNDAQTQMLNSIMEKFAKEAVRKICLLFRYCSVIAPFQEQTCLNDKDVLRKTPSQMGHDPGGATHLHNQESQEKAASLSMGPLEEPTANSYEQHAETENQTAQENNATNCLLEDRAEAIQTVFISDATDDSGWSKDQEVIMQTSTDQPEITQEKESFECDQCDKAFPKMCSLLRHKRVHSNVRPHSCEKCGKKFTQLRALETHLNKHTQNHEKKKFPCSTCGKSFRDLAAHELVHAKVKPFTCDKCGQGFTVKRSLYMHERVHTGEKPYICDICGKCFPLIGTLNSHKRSHSDERPLKCSHCNKSFKYNQHLRRHLCVHAGERRHTCETCGKSFVFPEILKRHILVHTGDKPYVCELCGRRFNQRGNLKVHIGLHGKQRFMSEMCGKTSQHSYVLQNHVTCGKDFHSSGNLKRHKRALRRRHSALKSVEKVLTYQ